MSAKEREAAKLAGTAYPYHDLDHDDIAISDRSHNYGVEGAKPTSIR